MPSSDDLSLLVTWSGDVQAVPPGSHGVCSGQGNHPGNMQRSGVQGKQKTDAGKEKIDTREINRTARAREGKNRLRGKEKEAES